MAEDGATKLYRAFVDEDPTAAISVIEKAKASGVAQSDLFDQVFAPAMSLLGGAWASGVIDEYAFTQAAVIAEQIASFVTPPSTPPDTGVVVIVGSMHKDRHSVSKNIIGAALKDAGHRVIDLGTQVRPTEFLERLEETGARILIVTAESVGPAHEVVRVREALTAAGYEDVVVLVAGGPFSADSGLARSVGANGVIGSAEGALRLVSRVSEDILDGGGERDG